MLIGYNTNTGAIEFMFSDSDYLKAKYPNNTARITNFWKNDNHGLKEIMIDEKDFPDFRNYNLYKIVDGKAVLKSQEDLAKETKPGKSSVVIAKDINKHSMFDNSIK